MRVLVYSPPVLTWNTSNISLDSKKGVGISLCIYSKRTLDKVKKEIAKLISAEESSKQADLISKFN